MALRNSLTIITTTLKGEKAFSLPLSLQTPKDILFSINEYDDAVAINESEDYEIYIENIEKGGLIKLPRGERVSINKRKDPCPALDYKISIVSKASGRQKTFLYKISRTNVASESQYKTMISTIERYEPALLYEEKPKYLSGKKTFDDSPQCLVYLSKAISSSKGLILKALNSILEHPFSTEEKILTRKAMSGRESSRSIKKNVQSPSQERNYCSRIVRNFATKLNRYLIYMLSFSQIQLRNLIVEIRKDIEEGEKLLDQFEKDKLSGSFKRKRTALFQTDLLNGSLNEKKSILASFQSLLLIMEKVLKSDEFENVPPCYERDESILFHSSYLTIERKLFLPLLHNFSYSFGPSYSEILAAPLKQTSKLFEAYCLFSIDSAIRNMGFSKTESSGNYGPILKRFEKEDYEFEIDYSVNAKDVSIAKKGEFYYIEKDTSHISPDFFVILKKNGTPLCLILLDAKCRRAEYVQNDIVNGKYEDTIRQYISLRYASCDDPFKVPKIVDFLFLLFPKGSVAYEAKSFHRLPYRFKYLDLDGKERGFSDELSAFFEPYLFP